MTLGETVHAYRKNHGISMEEFARLSKLSKGYISMLEKNKNPRTGKPIIPSIATYNNLATAMNISPAILIQKIDDANINTSAKNLLVESSELMGEDKNIIAPSIPICYRNIKRIREEKGMSQDELARLVGFKSRSSINKIEMGINDITQSKLVAIAKALHVSPIELMGEDKDIIAPPASPSKEKTIRIPILGRVAAGNPIGAIEEVIGWEEISKKLAAGGACFALRVCGHSMEPRILEGDTVIVRQQPNVDSGDIAVVLIGNEEATLKRVKKQKDGIILVANNPAVYEPHFYSNREVRNLPVRILGKVVEIRCKP